MGGYQAVERWGIINVSGIGVEKGEEEAGRPDLLACRREGGATEARKACRGPDVPADSGFINNIPLGGGG